jgi:hypothetical protein
VPTLNLRATVVAGTSGTTWNTTANAVDGAFGTNNATYCNWTNTTANAVGYIKLDFTAAQQLNLPAGAVISDFSVTVRHYESNASRIASVVFQPYIADTAIAGTSPASATTATAARSDTATFAVTAAQFADPNFNIRVTATRFNGTQAGIFYLDYVDVVITYVAPPTADFTISDDTPNVSQVVTFTDTSTGEPSAWAWDFGANASPATANTQGPHNVTYSVAGNPSATLTVTNAAGSDPHTVPLVVSGLPVAEVWNGTRWVVGGAEMWNGTAWVTTAEVWNGTRWVKLNSA